MYSSLPAAMLKGQRSDLPECIYDRKSASTDEARFSQFLARFSDIAAR
jgi:hypothetical protein